MMESQPDRIPFNFESIYYFSDETPTTPIIYYPSPKDTECPMTDWEEWLPCSGICTDNVFEGYQSRTRYHIVDGIAVGKFAENVSALLDII